jgi:hypothetical protein
VPRAGALAVVGVDDPAGAALVPGGGRDLRREPDVTAQVEAVGDGLQVVQDLRLRGEPLAPAPLALEGLIKGVGIVVALDVAASTG